MLEFLQQLDEGDNHVKQNLYDICILSIIIVHPFLFTLNVHSNGLNVLAIERFQN